MKIDKHIDICARKTFYKFSDIYLCTLFTVSIFMLYLHIVWFVEQPKIETIVVTGNKLELTCRAEAAPGMIVDYIWFKCLKKDGTHKKPTSHIGNRMIIPVCDETS